MVFKHILWMFVCLRLLGSEPSAPSSGLTLTMHTHLSQSHELAAVERLCETREATGTRTGTRPEVPSVAEETRPY